MIEKSPTPLFQQLVHELPESWSLDEYVLVGSATLAARGARDVHDLDVLVSGKLWPYVKKHHWPSAERVANNVCRTAGCSYFDVRDNTNKDNPVDEYVGEKLHRTPLIDFLTAVPRIYARFEDVLQDSEIFEVPGRTGFLGAFRTPPMRRVRVMSVRHCIAVKALVPHSVSSSSKHARDISALSAFLL